MKTNLPHCMLFWWWVEGGVSLLIFNIGFMWRWMVGSMLQPLYLWWTIPLCPWNGRLSGPQSQFGCHGVEKNLLPLPGTEPLFLSCPTCSIAPLLLYILLYNWNNTKRILLPNFSMSFELLLLTTPVSVFAVTVLFSFCFLPLWHFLLILFYSF